MRNDKKNLYILIMIITTFFITIGYAVLNSTLNINGKSNISKNTWDVHFDNVVVRNGSVEATKLPTIENNTTVNFETQLNLPGDFYEFTVDVVNNGTIDAMIESIEKTPILTDAQQKYFNYIITYENDESITTKQLVNKESYVRLKVKVELRKDIDSSDLPEVGDVLYLSFTVNYVQADENGVEVIDNGIVKDLISIESGNVDLIGSVICIGEECFYVISSTSNDVTLLSKYNLHVGNKCTSSSSCNEYGDEATGIQNIDMVGYVTSLSYRYGTTVFSSSEKSGSNLNDYNGSIVEDYVNNYKNYLESLGIVIDQARLISRNEAESLGCEFNSNRCNGNSWVHATSYWTGIAASSNQVWAIYNAGFIGENSYSYHNLFGVRPVIVISKDYF